VGDDVRQSTSSARPVGDVGREGEVVEKAQVSCGRQVAECRPRAAGVDGCEVELPAGERGRVEAIDAGMDAVELPASGSCADSRRAEPPLSELLEPHQVLLASSQLGDFGVAKPPIGE
jgi:hypothetical protein